MNKLFDLFRQGNAIIFAGSGISLYAGYPQSKELAEILIKKIPTNKRKSEVTTLPEAAEQYCKIFNRDNLIEVLKPIFEKEPLSIKYHKFISEIPQIRKIITTNYDRTFEKA